MKEVSWSELRKLTMADLKASACLRVTGDGVTVFYIIVQPQGGMVARVESIASMIDASKGF